MPNPINWDEQKRQQQYLNWRASQNALNKMPKDAKEKGPGRRDRKALFTTVAIFAVLIAALVLLGHFGVI